MIGAQPMNVIDAAINKALNQGSSGEFAGASDMDNIPVAHIPTTP
ncbi:MAG: hypothetical protein ABFS22_10090 [Pseudomonadota bacterium]